MSRRGSVLFSAPAAHYGGEQKTIEVLRQTDDIGRRFERIGRLGWRKFENSWTFMKMPREGTLAVADARISGVGLREAKRLVDLHYGNGDHPR